MRVRKNTLPLLLCCLLPLLLLRGSSAYASSVGGRGSRVAWPAVAAGSRHLLQASPPCGPGNASSSGTCGACSPGTYAVGNSITFVNGVDTSHKCDAFANPAVIFNFTVRHATLACTAFLAHLTYTPAAHAGVHDVRV
jgi:hypothetical protein